MTILVVFLVLCQALGACIGVVMSVSGELVYIRDMRDGKIDSAEFTHLRMIAHGLRFGMTLLLFASLGLVIVAYISQGALQPALTSAYWILIVISLIVIGVSWALSRRRVQFTLGSAIIFTAWWFLAYLTLGWFSPLSFGSSIAFFVVATAIIYAVLHYVRMFALHLAQKEN